MQVKIITKSAGALSLAFCAICVAMLSGCVPKSALDDAFSGYEPSREYGFVADSSDVGGFYQSARTYH